MKTKIVFKCAWCGKTAEQLNKNNTPCSAPDGDGHIFDRIEVKKDKKK
jgi:hypothetical protein